MTHHIQGHPKHSSKGCLHCDLAEVFMEYDLRGVPMEDIVMEFATVMAVYICARDDDFRENMVSKIETGFREMVFEGDAYQIRTLIMHEPNQRH